MTRTNATDKSVAMQIAMLDGMNWSELKAKWTALFGSPPGINNRRYVERRLMHRIQEDAARKATPALLAANDRRIRHLLKTGTIQLGDRKALRQGGVLTKNHHGVLHTVRVLGTNRFEYCGRPYRSLSAIAREITGTRWSGPLFFGLKAATQPRSPIE